VEEIAMKKPKTVANLLAVADICVDAFEARDDFWSPGVRGPQGRRIVRSTQLNLGGRKDREDRGYRYKQSSEQKEKRTFQHPNNTKK
jgi:hypothetical protein